MRLRSLRQSIWAIPTLLAIGSLVALVVALAADGIWDVLSWAALAAPLAIVGCALLTKGKASKRSERE